MDYNTKRRIAQRIAIAKDALAWLAADALIAEHGTYVQIANRNNYEALVGECGDKQLRDINLGVCKVCAKGALFLAKAVRYDNVLAPETAVDIVDLASDNEGPLSDHFDPQQLMLIEAVFEGWGPHQIRANHRINTTRYYYSYMDEYPNDKERLMMILQNIIDNKGTFVYEDGTTCIPTC